MSSLIRLSIVIITHDRPEEVRRALVSCLEHFPKAEVLLMDNGTVALPIDYHHIHPNTHYRRLTINISPLRSRNIAYRMATGSHILNLDDDAYFVQPDFTPILSEALRMYPTAGIICCNLREEGTLHFGGTRRKISSFFEGASIFQATMLRQGIVFDERQAMYGENLSMTLRALSAGYECILLPDLIIEHAPKYRQRTAQQNETRTTNHLIQNSLTYFRYFPLPEAMLVVHALFFLFFLQAVRQPRLFSLWIRAGRSVFKRLPATLKKRTILPVSIRSRYLFCEVHDTPIEQTVPNRFGALSYLFAKATASNHPLRLLHSEQ